MGIIIPRSPAWFYGVGTPAVEIGIDGDFYLDTANGDLYNKAALTWSVIYSDIDTGGETYEDIVSGASPGAASNTINITNVTTGGTKGVESITMDSPAAAGLRKTFVFSFTNINDKPQIETTYGIKDTAGRSVSASAITQAIKVTASGSVPHTSKVVFISEYFEAPYSLQWVLQGEESWFTPLDPVDIAAFSAPAGGTTGQALTKNTDTNGDFVWADSSGSSVSVTDAGFGNIVVNPTPGTGTFTLDLGTDLVNISSIRAAPLFDMEIFGGTAVDPGDAGGNVNSTGANGGDNDNANAGAGGACTYIAGNGGNVNSGDGDGGSGGTLAFLPGIGGNGSGTGNGANAGDWRFQGSAGGSGVAPGRDSLMIFTAGLPSSDPGVFGAVWSQENVLVQSGFTDGIVKSNSTDVTGSTQVTKEWLVDFTATFGAISALTGTSVTQTITGLATTDHVNVSCVSTPPSGMVIANARVSATDTLEIRFVTSVALGITLGSLNFRVKVTR